MGGFIPTCHTQAFAEMTKLEITMSSIDLSYKPVSYFSYKKLGISIDEIKGAERRSHYKKALKAGVNDFNPIFLKPKLSTVERKMLGSIHPAFMGGEYLPDLEIKEVEIARITIASTTQDVTCVYVGIQNNQLHYRIVDEYNGDTIEGPKELTSNEPLTLNELMNFFIKGWDIFCFLDANFSDYNYDPYQVKGFIVDASSSFYSEFGELLEERIDEWLLKVRRDIEEDEEGN
jgi:hypothetical protein